MATLLNLYLSFVAGLSDEKGQGLVEYALIIALVSIALVGALGALAFGIDGVFDAIVAEF